MNKIVEGLNQALALAKSHQEHISVPCDECGSQKIAWRVEPENIDKLVVIGMEVVILNHSKVAQCLGCSKDVLFMFPAKIDELTALAEQQRAFGHDRITVKFDGEFWSLVENDR